MIEKFKLVEGETVDGFIKRLHTETEKKFIVYGKKKDIALNSTPLKDFI